MHVGARLRVHACMHDAASHIKHVMFINGTSYNLLYNTFAVDVVFCYLGLNRDAHSHRM